MVKARELKMNGIAASQTYPIILDWYSRMGKKSMELFLQDTMWHINAIAICFYIKDKGKIKKVTLKRHG